MHFCKEGYGTAVPAEAETELVVDKPFVDSSSESVDDPPDKLENEKVPFLGKSGVVVDADVSVMVGKNWTNKTEK